MARDTFEIQKTFVVSTGHLHEDFRRWRMRPLATWHGEYGWEVWVGTAARMPRTAEYRPLRSILRTAKRLGCSYARFDVDGPEYDSFPWFE